MCVYTYAIIITIKILLINVDTLTLSQGLKRAQMYT